MSHISTKSGDRGETSLCGGERISKAELRVDCYGELDALEVEMGEAIVLSGELSQTEIQETLQTVQLSLRAMGQILSSQPETPWHRPKEAEGATERVEALTDHFEAELPPLRNFVTIGQNRLECALHRARVQCRRCERLAVRLSLETPGDKELSGLVLPFLNRLSDLLFTLARRAAESKD